MTIMSVTDVPQEYASRSLDYFKRILELCRENNIALILVTPPRTDWTYGKYLSLKEFAESQKLEYIDYNLLENMERAGLTYQTDFQDINHVNANGALKLSKDLGEYLQNKYQFTDKRQDPAFAQWNLDLKYFKSSLSKGWANPPQEDASE